MLVELMVYCALGDALSAQSSPFTYVHLGALKLCTLLLYLQSVKKPIGLTIVCLEKSRSCTRMGVDFIVVNIS